MFGEYTRGKRMHKEIASHIFQSDIETSRQRLLSWIQSANFDPVTCFRLCQGKYMEIADFLKAENPQEIRQKCVKYRMKNMKESDEEANPPAWTGLELSPTSWIEYSYYATVYLRINCANALENSSPKINAFINAHIPVVRFLDSLEDPRDDMINELPYTGLGKSHYDEDRNAITIESHTLHEARPYPLDVIRKAYPNQPWTVEELLERTLSVREACLYICRQCKEFHETAKSSLIRDSLWFYHACFVDYFYNYKPEYDRYMPVELYPFDNRAFTAYDLPCAFHVLAQIPLWGEQMAPAFPLGKFIQKSLPFAGARRTLINHTDKLIASNEAFWKIFSSVFYCMLMDMYPEHLSSGKRNFDMNHLMQMKQIASDKQMLRAALTNNSAKENDKGCFIVFTAFRLWIVMMTDNQPHYRQVIDWDVFQAQTIDMAQRIRESVKGEEDIFANARELAAHHKMQVYRYRKSGVIDSVYEKMTECLEKDLYKLVEEWKCDKPAHVSLVFLDRIDTDISTDIKTNLLNALIRADSADWITICLSIMRVPRFGGVREESIHLIQDIINVYYKSAKPKDFEHILNQFHVPDFKVACWYFYVIHTLNKVDFQALTMEQVVQIDRAMVNRYTLFPGQSLPTHAYNIFFTICCGKIKTMQGSQEFGHRDIAYDMETNSFVCAKSHKKSNDDDFVLSEFETQRKHARKQRKDFNHIPCTDNPVLCVPLRGFMMIYNKTERYMHCPSCAAFHRFHWTGFKGGEYACPECRAKERQYTTCTVCGVEANEIGPVIDPLTAKDVFQCLYYCKKHYKTVSRF